MDKNKIKWKLTGQAIKEEEITGFFGFVYQITDKSTGNYYIGSKSFFSRTNPKISKKRANQLYSGKGRKKVREAKVKESNWKEYNSSSKKVQQLIAEKGEQAFDFIILALCQEKKYMLLLEAHFIITAFLNEDKKILNDWINIKTWK